MKNDEALRWVSAVAKKCVQLISENREKSGDIQELKSQYYACSAFEKYEIHNLLLHQFERKDSVFLLSYLICVLGMDEFQEDAAKQICGEVYDWKTQIMFRLQLKKLRYSTKMQLHRKSVECLLQDMNLHLPYIPVENRDASKIVIITEQLLSLRSNHAPTLMTLEIAYVLKKYFQYEVELYTCASNQGIPTHLWVRTFGFHSGAYGDVEISYKDMQFCAHQYPLKECGIDEYRKMLENIYKINPLFVLDVGVCNAISDLPQKFTTVVNLNATISPPASEADLFVRLAKLNPETEKEYQALLHPYQKQIFMGKNFPAVFCVTGKKYERAEWKLPEEKFLVAIVGNRLDQEVSDLFLQLMQDILQADEKIDFVVIGNVDSLCERLKKKALEDRVHYLGYCFDLFGVYSVLDLYLNPIRSGGGWSSAIAMCAGVPVVTLPECDVAYNVTELFTVKNLDEMFQIVLEYAEDSAFYERKKQQTQKIAKKNGEAGTVQFLTEMLQKIKEEMLK